jgi:hypothetical protein
MEAAFSSADRTTFSGSMTPASTRSTYSPVSALNPWVSPMARTFSTTSTPSTPALRAIQNTGADRAARTIEAPVA